uniref:Uncharacterized protein n=1 Tax=Arundo donax TaxID=35708 RepID=A0A0A8XRF4_ARUDO
MLELLVGQTQLSWNLTKMVSGSKTKILDIHVP